MENIDDIHFNMPKEDVILLQYALVNYRAMFKEDCKTGRRFDKIIKLLNLAIDHKFLDPKEKEKEEQ